MYIEFYKKYVFSDRCQCSIDSILKNVYKFQKLYFKWGTEKNYFEGIKNIIPDSLKNDLQIKIYSNKALSKIIDFAAEERNKDERFRDIWLVFDRDEVKNFDKLIEEAKEK